MLNSGVAWIGKIGLVACVVWRIVWKIPRVLGWLLLGLIRLLWLLLLSDILVRLSPSLRKILLSSPTSLLNVVIGSPALTLSGILTSPSSRYVIDTIPPLGLTNIISVIVIVSISIIAPGIVAPLIVRIVAIRIIISVPTNTVVAVITAPVVRLSVGFVCYLHVQLS